jgi:hypothetical protein
VCKRDARRGGSELTGISTAHPSEVPRTHVGIPDLIERKGIRNLSYVPSKGAEEVVVARAFPRW